MASFSRESEVVTDKEVVSCDLADEVAMLDMKEGVYYGLDPVGARIWNLMEKPITVQGILDVILKEYEIDEVTAYQDILELLEELLDKGLIIVKDG